MGSIYQREREREKREKKRERRERDRERDGSMERGREYQQVLHSIIKPI